MWLFHVLSIVIFDQTTLFEALKLYIENQLKINNHKLCQCTKSINYRQHDIYSQWLKSSPFNYSLKDPFNMWTMCLFINLNQLLVHDNYIVVAAAVELHYIAKWLDQYLEYQVFDAILTLHQHHCPISQIFCWYRKRIGKMHISESITVDGLIWFFHLLIMILSLICISLVHCFENEEKIYAKIAYPEENTNYGDFGYFIAHFGSHKYIHCMTFRHYMKWQHQAT